MFAVSMDVRIANGLKPSAEAPQEDE
jgi:hypothetical protein